MSEDSLTTVFTALASPVRRRMLDILQQSPGLSIHTLSTHFSMSGVGVLKHVKLLEQAGLIHSVKQGRERHLYFNLVPIQLIYDRWTTRYSAFWGSRVVDIKHRAEARAQAKAVRRA
jgi:predicted transcriptional regulator